MTENEKLRKALQRIVNWEMPKTDFKYEDGRPMSYAVVYGSQGQKDVIQEIARVALASTEPIDATTQTLMNVVCDNAQMLKIVQFLRGCETNLTTEEIIPLLKEEFVK